MSPPDKLVKQGARMSIRAIHLRKLLKVMYARPNNRVAELRSDIRDEIARQRGDMPAGGDFYGPFWADAKSHALGIVDLHRSVEDRVASNPARASLYPQLRDGFLLWWNERRRWTNEPFRPADAPRGRLRFFDDEASVKVDNLLSVVGSRGDRHFVYPYFAPEPILGDEAARLALWAIGRAFPTLNWDEIRVLDVIRGQPFSVDRLPLQGNEETTFLRRYRAVLDQWDLLRTEYP